MEKVIRALLHLKNTHARKKKLATELTYFRRRRHRMRYAEAQANALPIGSGVLEAIERMRRSGMRWRRRKERPAPASTADKAILRYDHATAYSAGYRVFRPNCEIAMSNTARPLA